MKNITKVISVLMVLVLAIGCFAACSDTKTEETTAATEAQDKVVAQRTDISQEICK